MPPTIVESDDITDPRLGHDRPDRSSDFRQKPGPKMRFTAMIIMVLIPPVYSYLGVSDTHTTIVLALVGPLYMGLEVIRPSGLLKVKMSEKK